ncbi:L-malate dehydrogenase [Aureococcus anophagefferens]|nr:L-malate dehydrogenase [Aureococcus anophagefferens]
MSLLIKQSPLVNELSLYDVVNTPGVAADLSHCSTPATVRSTVGMGNAAEALEGMDVVVIPAGVPRKPGMTRDDLFNTNASIIEGASFSQDDIDKLTHRIMFGGDEVVQAKDGAGSATLSMAYAGAHFTFKVLEALNGATGITECAFVESDVTDAPYFSSPVTLGKNGVETIHGDGTLSPFEQDVLDKAVPDLIAQAEKGVKFVHGDEAMAA